MSAGSHSVSASAPMKMKRPPHSWRLTSTAGPIDNIDCRQMCVTMGCLHFGLQCNRNIRFAAYLVDQVMRHAAFQRSATYDERHFACVIGEVDGGLAGRIPSANEMNIETLSSAHLAARRAVVDAFANELVQALDGEPTPRDPCRKNESPRPHHLIAIKKHFARRRVYASDRAGHRESPRPAVWPAAAHGLRAHRLRRRLEIRGSSRIREDVPACPPGASRSTTTVRKPSDAP